MYSIYKVAPSTWLTDAPENQIFPEDYQDEDCLSVNVWAPWKDNATAPLPVVARIHGGSFQIGAVDVPYYNPSRWVQRSEKHIMVGINYRLNIFGWPNATGLKSNELNLGYLDQRLAIEWIRDNIAEFGGDPGRITLWGHSAGSVAVDSYKFAYPHDPIVNGLIMSSGTAHSVVKFAPANFTTVAEHFKCDTSNATVELDCMRDVPFRNITAWLKQRLDNKNTPAISFTLVTDNYTSWDNFTTRALAGEFIRKPAIIGTTVNEWAPFLPYNATYGPNQTAADEGTLRVFLCPSVLTTHESWAGGNATTFRYLYGGNFSNISPRWWQGAYHSADLPLIFGTHGIARGESTPFEVEVSMEMQDYFLAFAEDPVHGLPTVGWHGYAGDSGSESALFGWKDSAVRPIPDRELEIGCDEGVPNGGPYPPTS